MASSIVIKVKYEDTLRRFDVRVVNDELDLSMDGLREKIVSMFKFAPDTQLNFTYIDVDNDVVTLVDDEDLRYVVRQALNPLRITVTTSTAKSSNSSAHSSGSSAHSLSALNPEVSEILKSLPEALREPLSKLWSEYAKEVEVSTYSASNLAEITEKPRSKLWAGYSKEVAAYRASNLIEINESFSKLGVHYLNQPSLKRVEAYNDLKNNYFSF